MAETERLKSSMTIPKAISLITDKQSVSFISLAATPDVWVGIVHVHENTVNIAIVKGTNLAEMACMGDDTWIIKTSRSLLSQHW